MSILITGGAGFFGRAFTRYLLTYSDLDRICIYSRGEHTQAAMRDGLSPEDRERLRFFIGDVRDKERLTRAMRGCSYVLHAAALKRIEVGNYAPDEVVKTNVLGTLNAVEAAHDAGIERFLFISSDKAWQPVSPYGQSKALAESLVLNANNVFGGYGANYSVVRYGNVWCSAGSVVNRWRALIRQGAKSVPVTDPECTRFCMLPEQAIELVADTLFSDISHNLVVPEYLPAFRLGDLADAMGVAADILGLPSWEKKHEGMRDDLTSDKARRLSIADLLDLLQRYQ